MGQVCLHLRLRKDGLGVFEISGDPGQVCPGLGLQFLFGDGHLVGLTGLGSACQGQPLSTGGLAGSTAGDGVGLPGLAGLVIGGGSLLQDVELGMVQGHEGGRGGAIDVG